MYLAILYAQDYLGSGENLIMSRVVSNVNKVDVIDFLCAEAEISAEYVDTILILENGNSGYPEVMFSWSARSGDF